MPKIAIMGPETRLKEEIAYFKLQYGSYKNCYTMHGHLLNITYGLRKTEIARCIIISDSFLSWEFILLFSGMKSMDDN